MELGLGQKFVVAFLIMAGAVGLLMWIRPGWSSREQAEVWAGWFEVSTIVVLALLVAAEVVALFYQERVSHLREQETETVREENRGHLKELNRRTEPRSFSGVERAAIADILKRHPANAVQIRVSIGDAEAKAFAEAWKGLLNEARWWAEIDRAEFKGTPVGILILVSRTKHSVVIDADAGRGYIPEEDAPEVLRALAEILRTAGMSFVVREDPHVPANAAVLVIGRKE